MSVTFLPPWFKKITHKRRADSRYEICIETAEDTHNGYCSDHEGLEVVKQVMTVYLPEGDWNLDLCSWQDEAPGHCCCGASIDYRVVSIQLLTSSST